MSLSWKAKIMHVQGMGPWISYQCGKCKDIGANVETGLSKMATPTEPVVQVGFDLNSSIHLIREASLPNAISPFSGFSSWKRYQ